MVIAHDRCASYQAHTFWTLLRENLRRHRLTPADATIITVSVVEIPMLMLSSFRSVDDSNLHPNVGKAFFFNAGLHRR